MLSIKTGVAIHIDYTFDVKSGDGRLLGTYGFVNNELLPSGLNAFGRAITFADAEFGVSNDNDDKVHGVLMPVLSFRLDTQTYENTVTKETDAKTVTFHSKATAIVKGFNVPTDKLLTIREFGIKGLSRVVLEDPYQNLAGIKLDDDDYIEVTVDFSFTYYTNNKTATVGQNTFGSRVDYTCEVFELPGGYPAAVRNTKGYASSNVMEILPIDYDIREVATADVVVPASDIYQQVGSKCDEFEHRLDMTIIGYRPNKTRLYGFVLKDKIRGIGLLVRFLTPVSVEREKRYEVGGYIKWSRVVENIDEGFVTVDLGTYNEGFGLESGITRYNVTRPPYTPEVANEIKSIDPLSFKIGTETVVIPAGSTMPQIVTKLKEYGLNATLLTKKPMGKKPSTFDFYRPDGQAHDTLVNLAKTDATINNRSDWLFPVSVVGGNYVDTVSLGENSWRWDCYFPYMGRSQLYVAYMYGGYDKAKAEINEVAIIPNAYIVKEELEENGGNVPLLTANHDATTVLAKGITTDNGKAWAGIHRIDGMVDPKITNLGYTATYDNDFDTTAYGEWVQGKTTITLNYNFLDLTTDVISDTAKNVTEFRVVYDSRVHNDQLTDVWIGGSKLGPLTTIDLDAFNDLYGLRVTKSVEGTKTTFNFKRPFTKSNSDYIDLFIVGNEHIAFNSSETAYLKILSGQQGFRVYNKTGSEISNSLYLEENAFMLAGIRLYQPLPEYMYKYRILTTEQAATYFGDVTIVNSLNNNLFTIGFANNRYSVAYRNSIDSRDPNLNSHSIYAAIGIDLTKIDSIIEPETVLFTDPEGISWTKEQLLNARVTSPEKIIDDTLYFAYPVKIVNGSTIINKSITSDFYNQGIDLDINIEAIVTYMLLDATIQPNPVVVMTNESMETTYTHNPVEATITSAVWGTLNPEIATVDQTGKVTGVTVGTTTLKLTLNNSVVTTADVVVSDRDITISCADAPNITTCMTLTGTEFGLVVNDVEISSSTTDEAIRTYFRDTDSFRIVNCNDFTKPQSTNVSESSFLNLSGEFDLYINGTLIGKDMTTQQILDELGNDSRIVLIDDQEV